MKLVLKYFRKGALMYLATAFCFSILIDPLQAQTTRDHRNNRDHRINEEQALNAIEIFKEWMIGANQTGLIDGALNITAPLKSHYSIKGLENRKFLQRKQSGLSGINWTSNASAETEKKESNWVFYPKASRVEDIGKGNSVRSMPILYGEPIAIVWQPFNTDVKKTVKQASNLEYSKHRGRSRFSLHPGELTYDWVILGGKTGTPVKCGERVVLFNLIRRQPLIYYPGKDYFEIGWPDSLSRKGSPFHNSIKRTIVSNDVWNKLIR